MALTPDTAFQFLQQAASRQRLGHAYLIVGDRGAGKEDLAIRMINFLGGASYPDLETAQGDDVMLLRPTKKSRTIGIEAMRNGVEKRLHLARQRGTTRVAVIGDADRMTPEAQNALLKTLEEPPPDSLIFLLTSEPDILLPTTRSRCIQISLVPPQVRVGAGDPILDGMRKQIASALIADGGGKKGMALGLAREFLDQLKIAKVQIEKEQKAILKIERDQAKGAPEGKWLEARENEHEAIAQSRYLQRRTLMCSELYTWLGDCVRCTVGTEISLDIPEAEALSREVAERNGASDLIKRMKGLEEMLENLNTNAQEGLVLEVGFLTAFG